MRTGIIYLSVSNGFKGLPGWLSGRESAYKAEDRGVISVLGRYPGGGHGNPLWCSCLEDPTDRGAQQATLCRVAKSWTGVKQRNTLTGPGSKVAVWGTATRRQHFFSPSLVSDAQPSGRARSELW